MARATTAPVPVMAKSDRVSAVAKGSGAKGAKASASGAKGAATGTGTSTKIRKGKRVLGGTWGASFEGREQDGSKVTGLTWERRFTHPGIHPYDEIEWELRTAAISS